MTTEQQREAPDELQQRIVDEIAALEDEFGRVTPELVLDRARDPQTALHTQFTWSDEVAAHSFRLDQARTVIRSVKYEVTVNRQTVLTTRYVHDVALEPREQGYRDVRRVDEASLSDATIEAEVKRVQALFERGLGIAAMLGRETEFRRQVRALVR